MIAYEYIQAAIISRLLGCLASEARMNISPLFVCCRLHTLMIAYFSASQSWHRFFYILCSLRLCQYCSLSAWQHTPVAPPSWILLIVFISAYICNPSPKSALTFPTLVTSICGPTTLTVWWISWRYIRHRLTTLATQWISCHLSQRQSMLDQKLSNLTSLRVRCPRLSPGQSTLR